MRGSGAGMAWGWRGRSSAVTRPWPIGPLLVLRATASARPLLVVADDRGRVGGRVLVPLLADARARWRQEDAALPGRVGGLEEHAAEDADAGVVVGEQAVEEAHAGLLSAATAGASPGWTGAGTPHPSRAAPGARRTTSTACRRCPAPP